MENNLAKFLLIAGIFLIIISVLLEKGIKIPFGRLPGDIMIKKENFSFYFPLATSIIISIILTLIFSLMRRWR
ncbi:MAG: DUF2905 domain-containing protein [Candidatus Omnitrophica bacterium]|nr:DUF2905 domain-containing protein [Candidatus Omnitrophota bacterium]MCM8777145.1 DUF2905 domain-containing protein [Candidatus Omnitrophota bacterium]